MKPVKWVFSNQDVCQIEPVTANRRHTQRSQHLLHVDALHRPHDELKSALATVKHNQWNRARQWNVLIGHVVALQVAWLDHNMIPLTYEDRRVVDDTRFSIVRPQVREWNLQVRDIRPEDEGRYRCTINTNPVRNKQIVLHVKGRRFVYWTLVSLE